jgi:hypothetical protein
MDEFVDYADVFISSCGVDPQKRRSQNGDEVESRGIGGYKTK